MSMSVPHHEEESRAKPQKNRAWRRRRLHAPRKKKHLLITRSEAKVYATLKSDAIRVILECTDSHAD